MKKTMILMIVTVAATSIGCNGAWPRRWCFRGDPCNDCATYETAPNYGGYDAGVVIPNNAGVIVPNLPALPGPAPTNE
ncbi:MAG: hypothetical protein QGG09_11315 [Pirellulaceae bacterium]|jgi:hypothetical protein|nr:hypothetical protein [Pirellulaceae bacterium]HJN10733.1 hypothetical protein [Pirellulaceae bacterium]